jgi:hypothetical protein
MVDDSHLLSRVRKAKESARRLLADDLYWLVYELPAAPFDRRSKPSLVFESDTNVRLVRNFPASWRALSDDELYTLSWET